MKKAWIWVVLLGALLVACDVMPPTKTVAEMKTLFTNVTVGMSEADAKTMAGKPTSTEKSDQGEVWVYKEATGVSSLKIIVKDGAVVKKILRDRSEGSSQETLTDPPETE
ncbi:MAG: hypothetical protein KF812_02020 [Fimbriimonadaceae bacterium]|nr:hypothetical protein [Fimbriimonadaceae bacterium]